jgi:hypothetical protein
LEQHKTGLPLLSVHPEKAGEMTDTSRTRIFQAIRDGELTVRSAIAAKADQERKGTLNAGCKRAF